MREHAEERRDARQGRRAYARPAIREFGPVGRLTQAGTATRAEGQGNSANDPTRNKK